MGELADLYESFKRIPTYVMIIMIFTVLQFIVLSSIAAFGAFQLRRVADIMERQDRHQTWDRYTAQQQQNAQPWTGAPPQYGPRN